MPGFNAWLSSCSQIPTNADAMRHTVMRHLMEAQPQCGEPESDS